MRQGLSYFHSTIFNSLPLFYRRIDTALKQVSAAKRPSLEFTPIIAVLQEIVRLHEGCLCYYVRLPVTDVSHSSAPGIQSKH